MPAGASTHPHTDCCSSPHSSRLCHTPTAPPPDIHCIARSCPPVKARQFPGRPSAPSQSSSKFRGAQRGLRQNENPSNPSKSVKSQTPFGPLLPPYEEMRYQLSLTLLPGRTHRHRVCSTHLTSSHHSTTLPDRALPSSGFSLRNSRAHKHLVLHTDPFMLYTCTPVSNCKSAKWRFRLHALPLQAPLL